MEMNIFVVDNDDSDLRKITLALGAHYAIHPFKSPTLMFDGLCELIPDIIILDIQFEGEDGFGALEIIKENDDWKDIPIIFYTSYEPVDVVIKDALDNGVVDFIFKSKFSPEITLNCIKKQIEFLKIKKDNEYLKLQKKYADLLISNIVEKTLSGHIERIVDYMNILIDAMIEKDVYANELRLIDRRNLDAALTYHDIGMLLLPEDIVKCKNNLNAEQLKVFRNHPVEGERLINKIQSDDDYWQLVKMLVLHHHENWDGTGEPYCLKGEQISLEGRILAIVETYEDTRNGEQGYSGHEKAVNYIEMYSGVRYDPRIVEVFLENLEKFTSIADKYK